MRQSTRALAIVIVALPLAAGCSRAARDSRVSSAPYDTQAAPTAAPTTVNPIPGHPPVTTTGVVAKFDPTSRVLIFQDGRTVMLSDQSQILKPKVLQPVDPRAIRPGDRVVVQNALPVGVQTAAKRGKRQRMATIASVDQPTQTVRMTDGSAVRVTSSTKVHKGMTGAAIVLTDLRPGDEVVIIMLDDVAAAPRAASGAPAGAGQPSALPSQAVITGSPSDPSDASEVMVFREAEAP